MEYKYKAKDEAGRTVRGVIDAEDENELADLLDVQNLYLLESAAAKPRQARAQIGGRIQARHILTFTQDLTTILNAGISITEGLEEMAGASEHARLRYIIEDVLTSIKAGSSLSSAFERHPRMFDTLYVSVVRAGETSGNLDHVLEHLSAFLEWKEDLRRDMIQAITYPLIVMTFVVGLVILLVTFVFPNFEVFLRQLRGPVPLPTQIIFLMGAFVRTYWWVLVLGPACAVGGFQAWIRTPVGRDWFDRFKLKVPIFGTLIRDVAFSRFCHFFRILFDAGVDISQTLTILEQLIGNTLLAEATRTIRNEVRTGNSLSASLAATGQFPSMIIRIFHIGETSGQLSSSLEKACRYYNKEIPARVRRTFALIEPMFYVFLAGLILMVALSIWLPLYQMLSTLSRQGR